MLDLLHLVSGWGAWSMHAALVLLLLSGALKSFLTPELFHVPNQFVAPADNPVWYNGTPGRIQGCEQPSQCFMAILKARRIR
jgi:hypothetical protein